MFGTEDDYAKAIKGATIHMHDEEKNFGVLIGIFFTLTLLVVVGYWGFNYYNNMTTDESTIVMGVTHTEEESEDAYIAALSKMEVDTIVNEVENEERSKADTTTQESLTAAISSIIEEGEDIDNSTYTNQLTKEIKNKVEKSRVVIVKQGDTLASLSAKYYGDSMKYNKIIASNSDSISADHKIYAGQKIRLPY